VDMEEEGRLFVGDKGGRPREDPLETVDAVKVEERERSGPVTTESGPRGSPSPATSIIVGVNEVLCGDFGFATSALRETVTHGASHTFACFDCTTRPEDSRGKLAKLVRG